MSGNGWHGSYRDEVAPTPVRPLRLVGSIDNERPVGLAVTHDPTMPVTLFLGDFAQLLSLSGDTPMAHQLENTPATVPLSSTQYRAVRLMLAQQGSEWAENMQDAISGQIHPSFLPPADDCNPHGIKRPERGA